MDLQPRTKYVTRNIPEMYQKIITKHGYNDRSFVVSELELEQMIKDAQSVTEDSEEKRISQR